MFTTPARARFSPTRRIDGRDARRASRLAGRAAQRLRNASGRCYFFFFLPSQRQLRRTTASAASCLQGRGRAGHDGHACPVDTIFWGSVRPRFSLESIWVLSSSSPADRTRAVYSSPVHTVEFLYSCRLQKSGRLHGQLARPPASPPAAPLFQRRQLGVHRSLVVASIIPSEIAFSIQKTLSVPISGLESVLIRPSPLCGTFRNARSIRRAVSLCLLHHCIRIPWVRTLLARLAAKHW